MSETRIEDRRTIVHETWEDGRHTRTGTTLIDAPGEIHHCDTPAEAAINAYAGAIRSEAIARMVAAAQNMIDYPIAAFLMPAPGETDE